MPVNINTLWVYRMIHHQNLEYILQNGIYYRNSQNFPENYVNIGNAEIISSRDELAVKCYPNTMVNDYVPFYFSVRTPMLYNIHTAYGANGRQQHEIIYLGCKVTKLTEDGLQWCFTDGNAAKKITEFYNDLDDLKELDWRSITTTDFRDDNADGDPDRKRKKHAEFLVKDHVPVNCIGKIVVFNQARHDQVKALVDKHGKNIAVQIDSTRQYYF